MRKLFNSSIEFFKAHPSRSKVPACPSALAVGFSSKSRGIHSTARLHPARISENGKIRRENEESLYFSVGPSVRGSCDPFSNLFPFAYSLLSSADRQARFFPVIPSRKRTITRGERGEGGSDSRARRSGRNDDGAREDDPALFAFY